MEANKSAHRMIGYELMQEIKSLDIQIKLALDLGDDASQLETRLSNIMDHIMEVMFENNSSEVQ